MILVGPFQLRIFYGDETAIGRQVIMNPKYSTTQAPVKKISSSPAFTSTPGQLERLSRAVSAHAGGGRAGRGPGQKRGPRGGGFSPCIEGPAARGSALGRARGRRRRGWRRPCCLPAASPPLLPAPSSLRLPSPLPPPPPPSPTEPLLSLLLQAMAAIKFFALVVQIIIQLLQMVGDELDEATRERMQQRAEMLSREMTRLLQELEQSTQEQSTQEQSTREQSGFAWGALLFAALQQWQFWAIAGALVLLFGLCWWLRKRSREPGSSSKEGSSRSRVDKEDQEEKPSFALDVGRISVKRLLDLPISFTMAEKLVEELLRICRNLSRNSFKPRLKPAIRVGIPCEGWSPREEDIIYRLLVPLQPPRGHAFHLELGTAGERPAKDSYIRVELECTCRREQLGENMLCFLHHPEEELRRNQGPSLLGTLCTGPYLDLEKTTHWFQILVEGAWMLLPLSRDYRLTVLPSRRSCKLRLTSASNSTLLIEMMFAVQQEDSDTFLSIE
ncbi:LOW QUALITY PROTEIN: inositol 1,4,5-trisphosphate receptor-interacting protein-like [Calonectris borealis]|uniref:LOW QUALITY PROTEIN: inositol 1,4,5-trisphosphate receptor-interacting protein-like n=1 Tax=Calonectris borealis TaxID=1323832 RepID=UPI003F4C9B02